MNILFTLIMDIGLINSAIYLSQAVYCNTSLWNCKTCDKNDKIDKTIEKYGEKIIIGNNGETSFIAFRGSTNIENWIDDVQFGHNCYENNICIEKGFDKLYDKLKYDIFDYLDNNEIINNNLLITGHSLGSALGTLLTYDLLTSNSLYNISLITFGSPLVGNNEFVKDFMKYNVTTYRVTHYYDIVPHLPQYNLNYHHIPNEIWYNEKNILYEICNDYNIDENENCSNSCYPLHCTSVSDHLNYLNITMGSNGDC